MRFLWSYSEATDRFVTLTEQPLRRAISLDIAPLEMVQIAIMILIVCSFSISGLFVVNVGLTVF